MAAVHVVVGCDATYDISVNDENDERRPMMTLKR